MGSQYCDPMMIPGDTPRVSTRQRWSPTSLQLQILERIFAEGNGTPSKQRTKEIASELSQQGPISETNVYNWFQNRRARSKRKQAAAAARLSIESEAETENKYSKVVIIEKSEKIGLFRSPEGSSDVQSVHPDSMKAPGLSYVSNDSLKSSGSIGKVSFCDSGVLNPSIGKVQSMHPDSMKTPAMSYISNDSIKSSGSVGKMSFCDTGVLNPSIGKVQSLHQDSMKTPDMSYVSNDSLKYSGTISKVSFCDNAVLNPGT